MVTTTPKHLPHSIFGVALHITNFRVPAYVPITLSNGFQQQTTAITTNGASIQHGSQHHHPLELTKPILLDCDYQYEPEVDARLTIRWFRNKEAEPFYQWLPELNVRHFADWIKPLINESFVADPSDPLKRYRSLLIKRLSMNLTAHYTCTVSSLAGQDMRQASLIVYQPPRSFTFEKRLFPPPIIPPFANYYPAQVSSNYQLGKKNQLIHQAIVYRPPNNDNQTLTILKTKNNNPENSTATRIVYTHDGRPIIRPVHNNNNKQQRLERRQISYPVTRTSGRKEPIEQVIYGDEESNNSNMMMMMKPSFAIQLHQFQCQATQVTPRPVIVLTVKRDSDSIAQYLHESSSVSIRPYQVNQTDYFYLRYNKPQYPIQKQLNSSELQRESTLQFTLYDITVSATIALNVSLPPSNRVLNGSSSMNSLERQQQQQQLPAQMNTILAFKRGQRMSFECHLEITGTEYEQRKRININEEG